DGIRDGHVTGVQTCALPIFLLVKVLHRVAARLGQVVELGEVVLLVGRVLAARRDVHGGVLLAQAAGRERVAALLAELGQRQVLEIGRASCRERVWVSVGGGA